MRLQLEFPEELRQEPPPLTTCAKCQNLLEMAHCVVMHGAAAAPESAEVGRCRAALPAAPEFSGLPDSQQCWSRCFQRRLLGSRVGKVTWSCHHLQPACQPAGLPPYLQTE